MLSRARQRRPGRSLVLALLVVSLTLVLAPGARALTISAGQAGIANFGQVNENFFRGAQPDRAGFQRLDSLGVRTVIDLQESGLRDEPAWVRAAGMQYYCIPLSSNRPATEAQTARFLELVNDASNWPVYVHCAGGRHRTGEMIAIYRITHDRWTADRAFDEMRQYDFYSFPFHGPLKGYVYRYYDTYRAALAERTGAPATPSTATTANTAPTGAVSP